MLKKKKKEEERSFLYKCDQAYLTFNRALRHSTL
jgi:hypothetical protein